MTGREAQVINLLDEAEAKLAAAIAAAAGMTDVEDGTWQSRLGFAQRLVGREVAAMRDQYLDSQGVEEEPLPPL